jgi:hypothetical protein
VFKTKLKPNGSLDELKACVVAKGYRQIDGIEYTETFSLDVKPDTIKMIIRAALVQGWPIQQLNVKNAFLHGNITEDMYMEQPPGMEDISANYRRLSMDLNKLCVPGLIVSAHFSLNMDLSVDGVIR